MKKIFLVLSAASLISSAAFASDRVTCSVFVGGLTLVAEGTVVDVSAHQKGDKTQGDLKNASFSDPIIRDVDVKKMDLVVHGDLIGKGKHVSTDSKVKITLVDGQDITMKFGEKGTGDDSDEKQLQLKDGRMVLITGRQVCQ
ncbi:MAG: hypothetical protein JST04_18235 [Bdellovibrionales bacterium]|nr:hypothetical protein [Bdellovibrionales bacterium]